MPPRRTGTIEERDGILWAKVTLPRQPGQKRGKRDRYELGPIGSMSNARARETAAAIQERIDSGKAPMVAPAAPPRGGASAGESLREWCERWIKVRAASGLTSTEQDRSYLRNHVWDAIGSKPIATVSADEVEDVRDQLDAKIRGKQISWKTASNVWGTITSLFADAHRSKDKTLRVRKDNPTTDLKVPDKGPRMGKQFLYPDEVLAFVLCEAVPLHWRRLVAVAVYVAARAGELRALLGSDYDRAHRVIRITKATNRRTGKVATTKSGEVRRFGVEPEIAPLLDLLVEEGGPGAPIVTLPAFDDQSTLFRDWLLVAGVTRAELHESTPTTLHITFHDLRATGITWWAARGDDPIRIMQRAGHSDFATTQRYIHGAESVSGAFGQLFPPLPATLLRPAARLTRAVGVERGDLDRAIVEILRECGYPVPPRDLATSTGRSTQAVWRAVRRLEAEGVAKREGRTNSARVGLVDWSRDWSREKSTPQKPAK